MATKKELEKELKELKAKLKSKESHTLKRVDKNVEEIRVDPFVTLRNLKDNKKGR